MLRAALNSVDIEAAAAPLPRECLEFLRANQVPADIIADLNACSHRDWLAVGPIGLMPLRELVEQNDGVGPCLEHGFLVLAGGANGDPIALDLRTRRMVFIDHEILWEREQAFDSAVIPTPLSYDEFWLEAVREEHFPCDSHQARERWPAPDSVADEPSPRLRLFRIEDE